MKHLYRPIALTLLTVLLGVAAHAQNPLDSARLALQNGDVEAAKRLLEPAYKAQPADTAIVLTLAEVYLREQDSKRAEQILETATNTFPEYGNLYVRLGIALNMRGKFKKAEEAFMKANSLLPKEAPERATLYVNLGLSIMNDNRPKEAVACFDKAIAANPRNTTAHGYRGMALYRMGDLKEAIEAYNRAIEIDDKNPITLYNRGIAIQKNGQLAKACLDYHAACKLGNLNACKRVMMECSKQNL